MAQSVSGDSSAVPRQESLMSQVKHKGAREYLPPRTGVKLGYAVDRAEERTEPEDVGEQALIRGLATAFPFFRLGLSRVWGRASIK